MTAIYVKNGTPVEGASKCASCSHAHILQGFRESEEVVYCTYATDLIPVPFKVRECSNYWDKHRPSWKQMQELAIDILPTSSAKTAGFNFDTVEEVEDEAETVNA